MKGFTVTVRAYAPYERKYDYRINASTEATAVARALRLFRREPHIARKQLDKIYCEIV